MNDLPDVPFHCLDVTLHRARTGPMHTHDAHEFFYCMSGAGEQVTDRKSFSMKSGDLFLFPEGMPHFCRPAEARPARGLVLIVEDRALSAAVAGDRDSAKVMSGLAARAGGYECLIEMSRATRRAVRIAMSRLVGEFWRKEAGYLSAVKIGLQEVLLALLRDPASAEDVQRCFTPARGEERLRDVLRYLREHYVDHITVGHAARMAHLGRSQFHAVFRQVTGRTLTRHVNELRVEAAVRLLDESDRSILDIGYACGFASTSQFYHVFREITGGSPGRRRSSRGSSRAGGGTRSR